jgi:hypothetical protein
MKINKGFAPIIIILAVVAVLVVVGVAYYVGKQSNTPVLAITPAPTSTSSLPPSQKTSSQSYHNSTFGISFTYPNNWVSKAGYDAVGPDVSNIGDYGLSIAPAENSLVTVEMPKSIYPNTNFAGAYFNAGVRNGTQYSQSQCLALDASPAGTLNVGGVAFNWTEGGTAGAGTDFFSRDYLGYANEMCYEFNLGYETQGAAEGTVSVDKNVVWTSLENVLAGINFTQPTGANQ